MRPTEDEITAVVDTYRSGWLTQGPRTRELEGAVGGLFDRHARVVGTATAALHLGLRAVGVGPGDEVMMSSAVAPVAAAVAALCGATPVVMTGGMERFLTARTTTLVVERRRDDAATGHRRFCDAHGVALVEDATALLGGRPAEITGDLAYLSFAAPSALHLGSGGAVLTTRESWADTVASLRSHAMTSGTWERHHGREETYDVVDLGYNYRFDEPRAVLALARLAALGARGETR